LLQYEAVALAVAPALIEERARIVATKEGSAADLDARIRAVSNRPTRLLSAEELPFDEQELFRGPDLADRPLVRQTTNAFATNVILKSLPPKWSGLSHAQRSARIADAEVDLSQLAYNVPTGSA